MEKIGEGGAGHGEGEGRIQALSHDQRRGRIDLKSNFKAEEDLRT